VGPRPRPARSPRALGGLVLGAIQSGYGDVPAADARPAELPAARAPLPTATCVRNSRRFTGVGHIRLSLDEKCPPL